MIGKWSGLVTAGVWVLTCLLTFVVESTAWADRQALEAELDFLLSEEGGDPLDLLNRSQRAQSDAQLLSPPDALLEAKACLALATALYLARSPADARTSLEECYASAVAASTDTLRLRLDRYRAVLHIVTGEVDAGIEQLEQIIARDHSGSDPMVLLRTRANYASALNEAGRFFAAIGELEVILQQAIDLGADNVVLIIGNNLMVLLIEQQMYEAAGHWHKRVAPFITDHSNPYVVRSIELHKLQLMILLGDAEPAAVALEEFLQTNPEAEVLITGTAHELLADAYRRTGQLDASFDAASRAVELLSEAPIELPDAQLSLVRTLLAQRNFSAALTALGEMDEDAIRTPRVREQVHGLRTRALLAVGDTERALAEFDRFLELGAQRARDRARQDIRFFEGARLAHEQEDQIQRIAQAQKLLEAEALASEARARESLAIANGARQARNLWIAFFVALTLVLGLLVYLFARRRMALVQSALNESLAKQVEEKSAALVATVAEQAELEKAMAQKAHTQAIGALTGNVAHDFNNLLQVISIANEQLGQVSLSPAQRSMLDGSSSALAHAKTLIQQLLAYARRQNLKIEPINLSHYINETCALLDAAVGDSIELTIDDQSDGACAVADASLLTTALLNLLSNSVDAMERSGSIAIRVTPLTVDDARDPDWPRLEGGLYLRVSVEDNGPGMTPDVIARACEPFFSGKRPGAGSGLGLSSVQGFARQCGGDLRIVSEPNVLTRVVLALPATHENAQVVAKTPQHIGKLGGVRVLVVEDNEVLSATLVAMLLGLGANVEHASTADRGLAILETDHRFDVALSDVRMSGDLDGLGLLHRVRERWPRLPVLLMTGHCDVDLDASIPVLYKPFSQDALVAALNRVRLDSIGAIDGQTG
ncbi:MAG: ATP-binding protein [Gammaproteobacteria bacterium]